MLSFEEGVGEVGVVTGFMRILDEKGFERKAGYGKVGAEEDGGEDEGAWVDVVGIRKG